MDAITRKWARGFAKFVKDNPPRGLVDIMGRKIGFKGGNQMFGAAVMEEGDMLCVEVYTEKSVQEDEIRGVESWLRRFAASMGRFCVDVFKIMLEDGRYSLSFEVTKELTERERSEMSRKVVDGDSFYIIGDSTTSSYMLVEDRGYSVDSCETTSDPLDAYRYGSFDEAVIAMSTDEDVILWCNGTPYPSRVRPLLVDVRTMVRAVRK